MTRRIPTYFELLVLPCRPTAKEVYDATLYSRSSMSVQEPESTSANPSGSMNGSPQLQPGGTAVGMIGVGDMGGPIARSILRAGYEVTVFDLRPQPVEELVALGANAADSVTALCTISDVVVIVVMNDAQVIDVVSTILAQPGQVRTVIVASTVLPSTVVRLHDAAADAGLDLIDAPVSGGAEKAAVGLLSVIVGGHETVVRRCWPLLSAFGQHLFHVGPAGAGNAGKLANNLLSLGGNILQLEAMQLATAYGISEDDATRFMTVSAGDSRGIRTWGRLDRARRTHNLAGTPAIYDLQSKDVRNAAIAAGERGVTLPVTAGIGAMMSDKLRQRDEYLERSGRTQALPRCSVCGQELAVPYRENGVHPECRGIVSTTSFA
jgi:3-hydroxyisobutyrate dehydrogenase